MAGVVVAFVVDGDEAGEAEQPAHVIPALKRMTPCERGHSKGPTHEGVRIHATHRILFTASKLSALRFQTDKMSSDCRNDTTAPQISLPTSNCSPMMDSNWQTHE